MTSNVSPAFEGLCHSIRRGRCVAFVGAGFSAPGVPTWTALLAALARNAAVDESTRAGALARLEAARPADKGPPPATLSALELEGIAQLLRDCFETTESWERAVKTALDDGTTDAGRAAVRRRVDALKKIPFRAILTTNFDGFLEGAEPSGELYREILRKDHPWWNRDDRYEGRLPQAPVVKLHGDANGSVTSPVVLQRAMYRERLYGDPRYAHFVRSVFASYDVLFLGVSFTDAYLNELRSEVLSFLYTEPASSEHAATNSQPRPSRLRFDQPWGYALIADPAPTWTGFLRKHEGIEVLPYRSDNDHAEFHTTLEQIAAKTSASGILSTHLSGKTVVWIDTNGDRQNNVGIEFLKQEVGASVRRYRDVTEVPAQELIDAVLFITNWTGPKEGHPVPRVALERIERVVEGKHAPLVVFAGKDDPTRRRDAIEFGAWEYTTQWPELFQVLCRLFDRTRTGKEPTPVSFGS